MNILLVPRPRPEKRKSMNCTEGIEDMVKVFNERNELNMDADAKETENKTPN